MARSQHGTWRFLFSCKHHVSHSYARPPLAACAKAAINICPSYAMSLAADNSTCGYCINKSRLVTTGPNAGKCAAACAASQTIYSNGTCSGCLSGTVKFNETACISAKGGSASSAVPMLTQSTISGPQLASPVTASKACAAGTIDCGTFCVLPPYPTGSVCYMTTSGKGGPEGLLKCRS
jgi:hypothetical protein